MGVGVLSRSPSQAKNQNSLFLPLKSFRQDDRSSRSQPVLVIVQGRERLAGCITEKVISAGEVILIKLVHVP